jgi:hypothetical protein
MAGRPIRAPTTESGAVEVMPAIAEIGSMVTSSRAIGPASDSDSAP